MTHVIDQLHTDHLNLVKIIELLKRQYETMRKDEAPDFNLMLDIMDYIHNYPDFIHHPRENVVFKVYLENHSEMQDKLKALMEEHLEIAEATRDLYDAVDGILNDSLVDKIELETQIGAFIKRQMRHMDAEEAEVFPMLKIKLSAQDLQRIDAELPAKEDPLFGELVKKRYEALYQHITNL
jgi:hemerythrin-like domain-containing protein